METTTINNSSKGQKKQWSKAALVAAVASGAITVEAANLIWQEMSPSEPFPEIVPTPTPETNDDVPDATPVETDSPTEAQQPVATPEPVTTSETEATVEPEPMPEPQPLVESTDENPVNSQPVAEETVVEPSDEDLVDVIVQEIDPNDNEMADVINVDEIGTIYTTDGQELTAAVIHDPQGGQALLVDVDGDNIYDVITTEHGEVIAQANGDIDVSDVENMYTVQHGDTGYLASNEFDNNMNVETNGIQEDIEVS